MVRRKPEEPSKPLPPPAKTLEGREQQLTAATYDLVEQRIYNGTATSQETVHFLRAGSVQSQMVLEKLKNDNALLQARVKELESKTSGESMYADALAAFRGYAGVDPVDPEADDYDPDLY
jgi:hypothetical protein